MIDDQNSFVPVMIASNIAVFGRLLTAGHRAVDGEKTRRGQQLQSGVLEFFRALAL
jgi:hypothetical protein